MIEAEEMADLVQGHRAHGFLVQHLTLMVVHREDYVGVGDEPLVVARPLRAPADWLAEVIDPGHVHFGVGGVVDEDEAEWDAHFAPFLECLAHAVDVAGHPVIYRRTWLN